jgi:NhaA family Na+:H+ antiporter
MGRPIRDRASEYLRDEQAGGFALLVAAAVALVWVNVWGVSGYESLWTTELRLGVGDASISEDLRHWVNDGLMAVFFFLISLEVKREILRGELRHPKAAALPILAALGGVVVPVLVYLAAAGGGEPAQGWGIPMATDAAFAIAVLAVLGDRVPVGAKLFLVTLAVVDDVAAICVIAVAFTSDLAPQWLALTAIGLVAVAALFRASVLRWWIYLVPVVVVWVATFESGVHATLAGVALALIVPAGAVRGVDVLEELEDRLHPFSSFVVLPLFALANAGIVLGGDALSDAEAQRVGFAVALGLVVGKFLGVAVASLAALRFRIGRLPEGVDRRSLLGLAALAGIGFTVSLFIAPLAFTDPTLLDGAKTGVFAGSVLAAVIGVAVLAPGGRHASRDRSA